MSAQKQPAWLAVLLLIVGGFLTALSCATSPTGRKQLVLLPEDQMAALGAESFLQMQQQTPVSKDTAVTSYVKCVASEITREVDGQGNWEVKVFDADDTVNAFALPGGHIGVYTGLLKVAENQDQLAAVIGHEVGHVLARHGNERVSQAIVAETGMATAAALMGESRSRDLVLAGLGIGTQIGVLLPFSRKHESEADQIGLEAMAKAGFNPQQSVELWRNMAKQGGGAPPEILSTHPSHQTRINDLGRWSRDVQDDYQRALARGGTPNCQASAVRVSKIAR